MTNLLLAWLALSGLAVSPAQPSEPLRLDVRIFDGVTDVTASTLVTLYDTGSRVNPRRLPLAPSGERQVTLPAGQYDLQMVREDEGRVRGVRWTSLRLLAAYPGEHGRHLEVLNLRRGFGALQVRRAGSSPESGQVGWGATLHPPGGGAPVASGLAGDGYVVLVAPPGRYDLHLRTPDGQTRRLSDVEVVEELTYLKSW